MRMFLNINFSAPSALDPILSVADSYTSEPEKVTRRSVFVAMESYSYDGHDRLEEVWAREPLAVLVEESKAAALPEELTRRAIQVDSEREAHRYVARAFRERFAGPVVAVAGSNGKTTSKEFIHALLSRRYRALKTEGSRNGHRGIPITLERLDRSFDLAIIEIGIDGPGEMLRHDELVRPDVAVLTSIGEEHLRQLRSIETVFREERILGDRVTARGGSCFVPADDPCLGSLAGEKGYVAVRDSDFPDVVRAALDSRAFAPQIRRSALLAAAVARSFGLSDEELARDLLELRVPEGRGRVLECGGGWILIEDHYNANPSSMRESVAAARALARQRGLPLALVLGDMLDLGERTQAAHREFLAEVSALEPERAILVGSAFTGALSQAGIRPELFTAYRNAEFACTAIAELLPRPGVVLVKGSRGTGLGTWIEAFEKFVKSR